jgi:formate-dependent phosphoribosylglycinamide formyltransferase (GAR transformylase)
LQYATRTCLAQAGLPTPRNARISAPSDVQAAADHVGFPSVIKPVSGAASIGVIRVNDMEQLQKAYERVVRDLSRAKVRWLTGNDCELTITIVHHFVADYVLFGCLTVNLPVMVLLASSCRRLMQK